MDRKTFTALLAISIAGIAFCASCGDSRSQKFAVELAELAGAFDAEFIAVRHDNESLAESVRRAYADKSAKTPPFESLLVEKGGNLTFSNKQYFAYKDNGGPSIVSMDGRGGFSDIGADLKNTVARGLALTEGFKEIVQRRDYCKLFVGIAGKDYFTAFGYPYGDWGSMIPDPEVIHGALGGDFRSFPFYAPVTAKNDPERKALWSPDVFVSMDVGVLFESIAPVYLEASDPEIFADTTIDIFIDKFNEKHLLNDRKLLLLASPNGTIAGASKTAIETLRILLPTFDYLKQLSSTQGLGDRFGFGAYEDAGLRTVGEKLAKGESTFETEIGNTKYAVFVERIPEVGFRLVGLIKR